jgi:hypothetical protein
MGFERELVSIDSGIFSKRTAIERNKTDDDGIPSLCHYLTLANNSILMAQYYAKV